MAYKRWGSVFEDGRDVLVMRVMDQGTWVRPPEPSEHSPTAGVPRFRTTGEARKWLQGQGAITLAGQQVAIVRLHDFALLEVRRREQVSLLRKPRYAYARPRPVDPARPLPTENLDFLATGAPPRDNLAPSDGARPKGPAQGRLQTDSSDASDPDQPGDDHDE